MVKAIELNTGTQLKKQNNKKAKKGGRKRSKELAGLSGILKKIRAEGWSRERRKENQERKENPRIEMEKAGGVVGQKRRGGVCGGAISCTRE